MKAKAEKPLPVDLAYYERGFTKVNTGGGCMAYYKTVQEIGMYVLVTVQDDANVPAMMAEPVTVGLYESGGNAAEVLVQFNAPNTRTALERLRRGDWTKAS